MIVIFSKDRAFQLEACLRSLLAQCGDARETPIRILWTASSDRHFQSYQILLDNCKTQRLFNIEFIHESFFRSDLLLTLAGIAPSSWKHNAVRFLTSLSGTSRASSFAPLLLGLLVKPAAVLFVVDDSLFLRPFNFAPCAASLLANPERLAFSLRLGQGVTRSYMGDCEQEIPPMELIDEKLGIFQFRWPSGDIDFEYPLEISSSILNLHLILPRLLRKSWKSPNTLEFALAKMAGRYKKKHPILLTFDRPRAVSAPLNIVQKDFLNNRHGVQDRYHPDALCDLFLNGIRADLTRLDKLEPNSVHIEIDLLPVETK